VRALLNQGRHGYADFNSQILEDHCIQVVNSTVVILNSAEDLGRQIRGEEVGEDLPNAFPGLVQVPEPLQNVFRAAARQLYPDLSKFPLDQGINEVLFYYTKVSTTPDLGQTGMQEIPFLHAVINIMRATWTLRVVKAGHGYQTEAGQYTVAPFEQQMDRWGFTLERFFERFEDVSSFEGKIEVSLLIYLGREGTV
jgi:hypothetical protein